MPAADDPHVSGRAAGFSSHRARVTVLEELSEVLPGSVGRLYVYSAKTLHIVTLGPLFGRVAAATSTSTAPTSGSPARTADLSETTTTSAH